MSWNNDSIVDLVTSSGVDYSGGSDSTSVKLTDYTGNTTDYKWSSDDWDSKWVTIPITTSEGIPITSPEVTISIAPEIETQEEKLDRLIKEFEELEVSDIDAASINKKLQKIVAEAEDKIEEVEEEIAEEEFDFMGELEAL